MGLTALPADVELDDAPSTSLVPLPASVKLDGESPAKKNIAPWQDPKNAELYAAMHRPTSAFFRDIPGNLDAMARSVATGGTFGQADKIAAAAESLTGLGGEFGNYKGNLAAEQARTNDVKTNKPGAYEIGKDVGLAASPINRLVGGAVGRALPLMKDADTLAPWFQRYANYGAQGGLLNSLYESTLGDPEKAKQSAQAAGGLAAVGMVAPEGGGAESILGHVKDFGKGALLGVAPAAAIEAGPAIMKTVLSPILSRLNPEEAAIAGIGRAADRSGLTPDMLASKIEKLGPAGMTANVGTGVTDYARDIAQFPGRARTSAQAGFNAQSGGKMSTQGGAIGRVEQSINANLSDETARATTDALVDLRTRTSSPGWREMFREPRVPQSEVLSVLQENPEVQNGMRQGLATIRNDLNAQGIRVQDGDYYVDGLPTFQAWHAGKEGLDDILFSGSERVVHPLTGQLTKYGRSVRNLRSAVLEEMQLQYPEYRENLNSWSGPTQAMRMIELGQGAAKGDARVTRELIEDMTPNERDFFRIGLADQAKYLVSKSKDGANVVKSIFGDQNQRRNIEAAFETREDFNNFRKALAVEEKFHASKQAVLGGSPTASRLLGAEDAAKDIGKATLEGAKSGGAQGAVAGALSKGWNYLKAPPEAVRDAAAPLLFSTSQEQKERLIEGLRRQHNSGTLLGSPGMNYTPGLTSVGLLNF